MQAEVYTASQIARALDREPRTVQRALLNVTASARVIVKGSPARGWEISALPVEMQKRLESEAERRAYRNAEQLLKESEKGEAVSPPADVHPDCYAQAEKLKRALLPTLSRMDDSSLSRAGLERAGIEDYARVFGKT